MAISICKHLQPFILRTTHEYCSIRLYSKKSDKEEGNPSVQEANDKKDSDDTNSKAPLRIEDIEEPTNCCMSGCLNCVWIDYAEKLSILLKDSPGDVQKLIMEKIQDPNMRAFLAMELRVRKIIE